MANFTKRLCRSTFWSRGSCIKRVQPCFLKTCALCRGRMLCRWKLKLYRGWPTCSFLREGSYIVACVVCFRATFSTMAIKDSHKYLLIVMFGWILLHQNCGVRTVIWIFIIINLWWGPRLSVECSSHLRFFRILSSDSVVWWSLGWMNGANTQRVFWFFLRACEVYVKGNVEIGLSTGSRPTLEKLAMQRISRCRGGAKSRQFSSKGHVDGGRVDATEFSLRMVAPGRRSPVGNWKFYFLIFILLEFSHRPCQPSPQITPEDQKTKSRQI